MALLETVYNPDILNCLANLSNDEVFTPPEVVNRMLDMLPQELFRDKHTTFLDPACKTGVFLREIAKRLLEGLKDDIPDEEERRKHIFTKQLYGIAITEMTSLLSRRGLYCSKFANGRYSIVPFDMPEGNIRFKNVHHYWEGNNCGFCGASRAQYDRAKDLEQYAYEFIHTVKPKEVWKMKFDVIIGNPPYQLDVGVVKEKYSINIFQLFVQQAIKLNPRYITMIIPDRWLTGGRGLSDFRDYMFKSRKVRALVDYVESADLFGGIDLSGGITYFLWEREYDGICEYTCNYNDSKSTMSRDLGEFPIFPRYNESLSIIYKICKSKDYKSISNDISPQTPYSLVSSFTGKTNKKSGDLLVYTSRGVSYVERAMISKGKESIDSYRVMFTKASPGGGSANANGQRLVFSSLKIMKPGEICTQTYLTCGAYESQKEAENILAYFKTKFVRFLLSQAMSSQDISREKFIFVPNLGADKVYTDSSLFSKYMLTNEEISFIESMIRPMDLEGADNA